MALAASRVRRKASTDEMSGLGAPLAHCDAETGAADIGAAPGHDLRLLGQCLDHRWIEHRDVERLARLDFLLDIGVDLEMETNFIAGSTLKLRTQLAHRRPGAVAAQHFDFGCLRKRSDDQ